MQVGCAEARREGQRLGIALQGGQARVALGHLDRDRRSRWWAGMLAGRLAGWLSGWLAERVDEWVGERVSG